MALWSAAGLWEWWQLKHVGTWPPNRWRAAFHGLELTPQMVRRQQAEHARSERKDTTTCSWVEPKNSPEQTIQRHALQENGGLADLWYMDDGDIVCHPILVPDARQCQSWCGTKPHRRRKSFTTWTTWMQHLPNEKLTT